MSDLVEIVRLTPNVGQTVEVCMNGISRLGPLRQFLIVSVSPAGKRCDGFYVGRESGIKRAFYRHKDGNRFVEDPGAGIGGSFLNPSFTLPQS